MIKIDKKIEIPKGSRNGRPWKYPWHELKIGDSFFIPHVHSIGNLVQNYNAGKDKKDQIKVTRRLEGEGQRVWRIK